MLLDEIGGRPGEEHAGADQTTRRPLSTRRRPLEQPVVEGGIVLKDTANVGLDITEARALQLSPKRTRSAAMPFVMAPTVP